MDNWTLRIYSVDSPGMAREVHVGSAEVLLDKLTELSHDEPRKLVLTSPEREVLVIGIGGPFAGIQWTKPPYSHNLRFALACPANGPELVDFSCGDELLEFCKRHLLPAQEAIKVILFFFVNKTLPDWLAWE
jgi:hypothetical protein